MTVNIPPNVESDIQKFAQEEHISSDEAVLRLIEAGLSVQKPAAQKILEQGLGLFGSPEDSALMDEVVSIAYEERRRPSKSLPI